MTSTRLVSQDFRETWKTPKLLYRILDKEFHFDHDPCPPKATINGIFSAWGKSNFVNPPYGQPIRSWLQKGVAEQRNGNLSVFLLPACTDVAWFHDYVLPYAEVRFIRGRLKFDDREGNAPFASMLCIFRPKGAS